MNAQELKKIISNCLDTVTFTYDNKSCGVDSTVSNATPTFEMWFGDSQIKYFSNVDDLMNDKFFNGKSLKEICQNVEVWLT